MEKYALVLKTKTILWLKLMTLSFVLAIGCAPKPKKSEAKLNLVSSMAIADINMNGGAIVYGQQQDGKGRWAKIFRPGDNVVVDMAQGVWNFSVVAYSGPTQLSGIRECGVLNKINIAEEKEVIDVFISAGQCPAAGVRSLVIKRCTQAQFDSGDPLTNCVQGTGIESYKLRLMAHRGGLNTGDFLESACITETNFGGGAGSPKVPMGITNVRTQPFALIAFTGTACDPGTDAYVPFKESLSIPSNSSIKSLQSGNSLALAINNDGDGLDTVAPFITFPAVATSAVIANSRNWINSANVSSFTISGGCETGLPVNLFRDGIQLAGAIGPASVACVTSTWSAVLDFSILPDTAYGVGYTIEARQTDGGGNTGSVSVTFDKDTTAPTSGSILSISNPTPINVNYINSTTPQININQGTDAGGSGPDFYTLSTHPSASCISAPATNNIIHPANSYTESLLDGSTSSFSLRTTDIAGNSSGDSPCFGTDIIVDAGNPLPPTGEQLNGGTTITNDNTPGVAWALSASGDVDSYEIELYDAGCGTLQSTIPGISSVSTNYNLPSLTNGTFSVKIVAVDYAGNRSNSTCTNNTIVDLDSPTNATGISFLAGLTNDPNSMTVTFSQGTDNTSIAQYVVRFYNDGVCAGTVHDIINVPGAGPYTASAVNLPLDGSVDGTFNVTIETQDSAGNNNFSPCSSSTANFDTTAPAEATYNASNWVNGASTINKSLPLGTWTPSVSGDLASQELYVYPNGTCTGTELQLENFGAGTTDFVFHAPHGNIDYSYRITSTDNAGNVSAGVCSSSIHVDQPSYGIGGSYVDMLLIGTDLFALTKQRIDKFDTSGTPLNPTWSASQKFQRNRSFAGGVFGPGSDQMKRLLTDGTNLYTIGQYHITVLNTSLDHLGTYPHNFITVKDAAIGNNTLFMTDGSDIREWNITNPLLLSALNGGGNTPSGSANCDTLDFDSTNDYLLLGCGTDIRAFDASTPGSLVGGSVTSITNTGSPIDDIIVDNINNVFYIATDSGGGRIESFNIGGPNTYASSHVQGTLGSINKFGNISQSGNILSAAGATPTTTANIFTVNNGTPTYTKTASLDSIININFLSAASSNTHFYGGASSGLFSADVSGGLAQPDASGWMEGSTAVDIAYDGNIAAVAGTSDQVQILDISDVNNPIQTKIVDNGGTSVRNVEVSGNAVFTLSGSVLENWNVSAVPSQTWSHVLPNPSLVVDPVMTLNNKAAPSYIFVGTSNSEIAVIDIAGPTTVQTVPGACGTADPVDMYMKEDTGHLFVACGAGTNSIEVYDASDPGGAGLSLIGSLSLGANSADSVTYNSGHLFVAVGNPGVAVIDVSDPTAPSLVNTFDEIGFDGPTKRTYIHNNVLYVVSAFDGVHSFNISTPASPTYLHRYYEGGTNCRGTPHIGNRLLLACGPNGGVQVINIENPNYIHQ